MKKTNVLLSAAVAGLFAVSAHAGHKKMPANEKDCLTQKMEWKDGACSCAANSCSGKDAKVDEKKSANSCGSNGCNAPTSNDAMAPSKK